MQTRVKSTIVKPKTILSLASCTIDNEPSSLSKAFKHSNKWVDAMIEEYHALIAYDT